MEEWWLYESAGSMQYHEDEEDDVHVMREPERTEGVTAGVRQGERVHQDHNDG